MKKLLLFLVSATLSGLLTAQTVVPNGGFETWTNFGSYSNPDGWDTPNEELMSIPFFGTTVVAKSTDHHGGDFSAKLETKHITLPPLDAPGLIITANLTLDIASMSFVISGGVPVNDRPCHLTGFYKFLPKGGDSCIVGIGLFRTTAGVRDSIGHAEFSTKDTVPDWTPFSVWIEYDTVANPDTMQVYALSSAQEIMTPGTILYVDDIAIDYITRTDDRDPSAGIRVYHDRQSQRLMVFCDFTEEQLVVAHLYNMIGRRVIQTPGETIRSGRQILNIGNLPEGIYILEILHGAQGVTKKYYLKN
jgi:hypothetical protein